MEDIDVSKSTLHLLAFEAVKVWDVKRLVPLLSDSDSVVRTLAAQQLQLKGDDYVFDEVVRLVDSSTDYVRESAAFVLGQLGTPGRPYRDKSLPHLLNMLNDESDIVRSSVVAALGHLYVDEKMPDRVAKSIVNLATDPSCEVRSCVAFSLGHSVSNDLVLNALNELKIDSDEGVRSYAELGIELLEDGLSN
jgi:HEAT repeat protein